MIVSIRQLQGLVESGALDQSFYKQWAPHAQGGVLDVAAAPQAFRADIVELVQSQPQIQATQQEIDAAPAEVLRDKNEQEAIQRYEHWLTKGDGKRRLRRVLQNSEKIMEAVQKTGKPVTAAMVDEVIRKLDFSLYWQTWETPASAQAAPPADAPPPRKLDDGSDELPLDASDFLMRSASVAQLQDLDRRRNPNRKAPTYGFSPMPPEITRKALVNCESAALMRSWKQKFGDEAIAARLQGRG